MLLCRSLLCAFALPIRFQSYRCLSTTFSDCFHVLMIYIKRSAILRFFNVFWGDVLNLVFGSYYSSSVDCEVRCVSSVTIGLIRLRFEQCSFVVDGLFIHGCSFYGSTTLRMSTRQSSVMLFVFSFRVTVTSCYLLRGVPVVAEEFLFPYAQRRVNFTTFHSLLLIILLPPPS